MATPIAPHELLKTILAGALPARPLFLPIVFSHATRIENLSLRTFLSNPTKITQALRQLRGHLRSDAMTCYFDPYLEMEALGAELVWGPGDTPAVRWPGNPASGDLPAGLRAIAEIATKGRVPVATEVIRRLKPMVREEVLLTVGVSGPVRLAAQLMRAEPNGASGEISPAALELASEVIAAVATAFVEAGANAVLINEELPLTLSGLPDLNSLLATTINIVRFYQALPVLLLKPPPQCQTLTSQQLPDCVICPTLSETAPSVPEEFVKSAPTTLGIAIPVSVILVGSPGIEKFVEKFRRLNPSFQSSLITTSVDIPGTVDLKNWNRLRDLLTA